MKALFIGRFQPFHKGHAELIRLISREYEEFIVGIGSAQNSYIIIEPSSPDKSTFIYKIDLATTPFTIENPFTAEERNKMIKRFLETENIRNYQIFKIPDINIYSTTDGKGIILPLLSNKTDSEKGTNKVSFETISSTDIDSSWLHKMTYIPAKKASKWLNKGISEEGWSLSVNVVSSLISSEDVVSVVSSIPRNTLFEWIDHVISLVSKFDVVFSNNPQTKELFSKSGYEVRDTSLFNRKKYSGTEIRKRMINDESWEDLVPEPVCKIIKEIDGVQRLKELSKS